MFASFSNSLSRSRWLSQVLLSSIPCSQSTRIRTRTVMWTPLNIRWDLKADYWSGSRSKMYLFSPARSTTWRSAQYVLQPGCLQQQSPAAAAASAIISPASAASPWDSAAKLAGTTANHWLYRAASAHPATAPTGAAQGEATTPRGVHLLADCAGGAEEPLPGRNQ